MDEEEEGPPRAALGRPPRDAERKKREKREEEKKKRERKKEKEERARDSHLHSRHVWEPFAQIGAQRIFADVDFPLFFFFSSRFFF